MSDLNRIQVGSFSIKNSIKIDDLRAEKYIDKQFISIEEFFKEKEKILLDSKDINYFINGVKLTKKLKDGLYTIYDVNNNFIGVGIIKEQFLKRDIVI